MKKVFFLLILGAVIGYFVTNQQQFVLAKVQQYSPVKIPFVDQQVAGASTSAIPKNFSLVQQELAKLNSAEIATASPQMKTIINLLQKLPKGQIRMVCQNVCNGIK
ncbi:MAG TPA: hypothetical protein VLF89_02635 [Candidatus Saccharimonadales bacterium]|nr:hypothetical protein [Candidatus Saccharimonadales bacterium]